MYADTTTAALPGGESKATSLLVCRPFAPVLSAVRQAVGSLARSRSRPVSLDSIHRNSCVRDCTESTWPSSTDRRSSAIADGVVVHNSLEQDADMVVLLHREDAYEKESPRAGEADLIVAKHRNGPTDTVTVAFQGHYSRFVDMAHT